MNQSSWRLLLPVMFTISVSACALDGLPQTDPPYPSSVDHTREDEAPLTDASTAWCPSGYAYDAGYRLCATPTEALGPFPSAMVEKCKSWGGGDGCLETTWEIGFARSLRGERQCPLGTTLDNAIGYCVEGNNVYGPFTKQLVGQCKAKDGGAACESMRWGRSFVPTRAAALAVPYFYQYNNDNEPSGTCGLTSAAMLLRYYGKNVTPDTLYDRFGKGQGQSPPGLEAIYEAYGLYGANTYDGDEAMLKRQLDAGRPVVVHGSFTRSGHIMIVIGYDANGYLVNDPAGEWAGCSGCGYPDRTSTNGKRAKYSYSAMRSALYDGIWMSTADTKAFSL